eukprot:1891936-Alexandrium_andersonii.AAC.1
MLHVSEVQAPSACHLESTMADIRTLAFARATGSLPSPERSSAPSRSPGALRRDPRSSRELRGAPK